MIRAILLDLGNVLVGFDFARGYRALAEVCRHSPEEIPQIISACGLVPPYERGEISSEDFFVRLSQALGLHASFQQFCDLWTSIFLPGPLLPEGMLIGLRRRYPLVLVSNTNDIHYRMIEASYSAVRHFDAHILSYRVGAAKPSGKIYQEAVRAAGCRPEECFFTDDVEAYVEAARKKGLDAVQFQGTAELERELRRRGVEWD
ncbi:MAG: HAD family phosphatase [Acidobacteria bacterium]|nr:HAD family phosphatase [Acidobacteriota bacterium]